MTEKLRKPLLSNRFVQDRNGASAVEFALLAPIFFTLIFGLLELGWLFLQQSNLSGAVDEASRLIYVGANREGGITRDAIETIICTKAPTITNCKKRIVAEIVTESTFEAEKFSEVNCKNNEDEIANNVEFKIGAPNSIAFLRVCVLANPFTSVGANLLHVEADNSGAYQLIAQSAFLLRK